MLFALVLAVAATVSLKPLEAIIIDANYMPSAPKQQVHAYTSKRVVKQREPIVVREKQNEEYHVAEESYPTAKPLYKYGYSVFDPYTLDIKSQWEHRDGDFVRGAYNMLEADGSLRIVEYTSDKDNGFRAIVKKIPFFLEQSRRQVENVPKYTSRNNPAIRLNTLNQNNNYNNIDNNNYQNSINNNNNNNNNYQNSLVIRPIINHNANSYQDIQSQSETPTPLAPIIYHHDPTANFHPHHRQQLQQQQQQQQPQPQPVSQNEVNGQPYNRQTENYVQHGKYFKQHYLSKQKQSASAPTPTPVIPAELYKMLPTL